MLTWLRLQQAAVPTRSCLTGMQRLCSLQEKLNPAVLTGTDLGDAVCISSNSDTTWYLAVKYIVGTALKLHGTYTRLVGSLGRWRTRQCC